MKLSKQSIDEFKRIYEEEFGEAITDGEAEEIAGRVMRLVRLLLRPLPKDTPSEKERT